MRKTLVAVAAGITLASSAHAGEYLGFDLCGPATIESVKANLAARNASARDIIPTTGVTSITVNNFKVIGKDTDAWIDLYKGKMLSIMFYYVSGLEALLTAKYGPPVVTTSKDELTVTTKGTFSVNDSDISIVLSNSETPSIGVSLTTVFYTCKKLERQLKADAIQMENVKKAAAADKFGL